MESAVKEALIVSQLPVRNKEPLKGRPVDVDEHCLSQTLVPSEVSPIDVEVAVPVGGHNASIEHQVLVEVRPLDGEVTVLLQEDSSSFVALRVLYPQIVKHNSSIVCLVDRTSIVGVLAPHENLV